MESLFSLCILVVMSVAHAYPPAPFFGGSGMAQCETNKACRIIVRTEEGNTYTSPQICACVNQPSCSRNWDEDGDRTVTMRLNTLGRREILMQLKYCQTVVPEVTCEDGQEALHVTGMTFVPTQVIAYNCTCRNNSPLRIVNAWKQYHQTHQIFVCS